MSDKTWWIKQYFKQLRKRFREGKVNRNKDYVVDQHSRAGSRDLDYYFTDKTRKLMLDGQIEIANSAQVRDFMMDQVADQIQKCGAKRVLEIGSGSSINLFLLSSRLPEVHFEGIDITPERVAVGKKWFKENKGFEPNAQVGDATNLAFDDDSFDLAYSVHCFEQMDQYVVKALEEACRVAKKKVILLEPDFKHSNPTQRLFLKNHNYLLNFDKQIESVAPGKLTHSSLTTHTNVLNRTGRFVIDLQ